MALLASLNVSASALTAQQLRMDILSQNMANVDTTRTLEGGPYQRRNVVFQEFRSGMTFYETLRNNLRQQVVTRGRAPVHGMGCGSFVIEFDSVRENRGVRVHSIATDPTPGRMVFDPAHPDADEEGYVHMPNVNIVTEMVDLISASRSYEANVTAMNVTKAMLQKTFELNRG